MKKNTQDKSILSIKFIFLYNEWLDIYDKNRVVKNRRSKLTQKGIQLLNEALQTKDFKCWIRESFNYFKSENSRKKNSPFWNGEFICVSCRTNFRLLIQNEPVYEQKIELLMNCKVLEFSNFHDEKIKPVLKFYGESRSAITLDILVNGTQNVLSNVNNKNEDELNGKYQNVKGHVLRKMKSEHKNEPIFSRELLADTIAVKSMVHGFNFDSVKSSNLNDYIQNISAVPYGFIIMSNFNVINFFIFIKFIHLISIK